MYLPKEVSEILNISIHTLRYYTNLGLVPNLKRDENNRRVFDDEAIDWLKGVIYLRELGMSLEAIKEYEDLCFESGDEAVAKRYELVQSQLELAQEQLVQAQLRVAYLKQGRP